MDHNTVIKKRIGVRMNKVTLKGMRKDNSLALYGFIRYKKKRDIPPYFTVEIDLDTIKPRKRESNVMRPTIGTLKGKIVYDKKPFSEQEGNINIFDKIEAKG